MSEDQNAVSHLLPVVSRRYMVDILDVLEDRPCTYGELRTALHACRRDLDNALRSLAALVVIERSDCPGSWDNRSTASARYRLTTAGRMLAEKLYELDIWTAMYEYYLYGRPLGDGTDV